MPAALGTLGGGVGAAAGLSALGVTSALLWTGIVGVAGATAAFNAVRHKLEIDRKTGRGDTWSGRNPNMAAAFWATCAGIDSAGVAHHWPAISSFFKAVGTSTTGSIKSLMLRLTGLRNPAFAI